MPMIKRYPNRKLYDTDAKKYITLDRIAELIRQGDEVSVIDYATGEDLTSLTLTQIIVEQEKKQSGLLPRAVLSNMIKTSGDRLNALQRSLSVPFNTLHQIDDEIRQRIQDLVKRGELTEREGQRLIDKLIDQASSLGRSRAVTEADIERVLAKNQIPTQMDLQRLNQQLEELSIKIEHLSG